MENSCTTDDIEALVTRWYFQRKQKIPEADKEWLGVYREQEAVAEKILWKEPLADVPESERKEIGPKERPAYGTKEFWKDWWARKKEKERVAAERAAAGLPLEPEPQKKKSKKKEIVVEQHAQVVASEPTPEQPKKIKLVRKKTVVVET